MTRARALFLALLFGCAAAAQAQYDVFAIRYATIAGFPVAGLVQGADKARKLDIAMMVWLVRGRGRNVLVDSGFYRPTYIEKWKPVDFLRPDEAVARAGVRADEVTDVVITHFHWDHADGADLFPKAQIWIQKEEYEHYAKDLTNLDAAKASGRLHLVDGDREILPGIRVFTGGKHTFASQYVVVGNVVLASDNVYLYENLEKHVPIAQTVDAASNLAAQDRMKAMIRDGGVIVPGHDPEVMTRFPKVNDRVVHIVVPPHDFRVRKIETNGHTVLQYFSGEQSDELATLASAILGKAASAETVQATTLNDGLEKVAAGTIAPELLHIDLQCRGPDGLSMQIRGGEAVVRPFAEARAESCELRAGVRTHLAGERGHAEPSRSPDPCARPSVRRCRRHPEGA